MKTIIVKLFALSILVGHFGTARSQDFVPSATSVASFKIGRNTYNIWPSINNEENKPSLWQFRYQPLFIPKTSQDGKIEFTPTYTVGAKKRTDLIIYLDGDEAQDKAYLAIKNAFPKEQNLISKSSISAIQVRSVSIDLPDLRNISSTAKLYPTKFDLEIYPATMISLSIEDVNDANINLVKQQLGNTPLTYIVDLKAKTVKQNMVSLKMKQLKNSSLYTHLNGLPTESPARYIHRDDFRKLSEQVLQTIELNIILADPERFKDDVVTQLMENWKTTEDAAQFDALKFASTYNADDLKPDVLTKTLDKMFEYNEVDKHYVHKNEVDVSAGANFLGLLNADAKTKISWSKDELDHLLRQHEIEASFEGNKIVAKAIKVMRVNINDFSLDREFFSKVVYATDVSQNLKNTASLSSYTNTRLQFYNADIAIGAIVPFAGKYSQALKDLGWLLCDGETLVIREYPDLFNAIRNFWGGDGQEKFRLPDLRGQFLRGVDHEAKKDPGVDIRINGAGEKGEVGSYQDDQFRKHSHAVVDNGHTHPVASGYSTNGGARGRPPGGELTNGGYGTGIKVHISDPAATGIGIAEAGTVEETRPVNSYVNYLIKWK